MMSGMERIAQPKSAGILGKEIANTGNASDREPDDHGDRETGADGAEGNGQIDEGAVFAQ